MPTSTTSAEPTPANAPLTTDTVPSVTTTTTTTTTSAQLDTGDVSGFEIISVRLGDRPLKLALADTPTLRSRGLMGVTSLGDLDGMLFAWDDPLHVSFWMKNTLIPLHIGYFDESGALSLVVDMVPCVADPCPKYPSVTPIRHALEALPGFFDPIALGESLTLGENGAFP